MENENEYKNQVLQHAKIYSELGLIIVPFNLNTKEPIEEYKNGISLSDLENLLNKQPINLGIKCTGGLFVLDFEDIEVIDQFLPTWAELTKETITVQTPKGIHIYLKSEKSVKSKAVKALSLTLIGEGDFVVLPPSFHPTGKQYSFFGGGLLDIKKFDGDIEDYIDKQLVKFKLRIKKKAEQTTQEELKKIIKGVDNEKEKWWARVVLYLSLRNEKKDKSTIEDELFNFNNRCVNPDSTETIWKHLEWLYETFPPISLKDVFNDKGIPIAGRVADLYINEKLGMVATTKDKEQSIYFFNGRVWEPAETDIASFVKSQFGDKITTRFMNEVINHIRWSTYDNNKILSSEPPPNLIPVLNGVFDIEKNKLIDYEPEHNFLETQIIPVEYNQNAKCPAIEKFLNEVLFQEDIKVIKEFVGFCLYRRYFLNKALILVGSGSNGKSVFLRLLKEFLGPKNVSARTIQELIYNRFAPSNLYRKLANIFADIPNDALKTTSLFKALTGEDMVSVEKKFGRDPIEFTNYAKLIFSANILPQAFDDTDAFYRRFILVEFPNKFEGDKADPFILKKLTTKEELSGLFNVAIENLRNLINQGIFSNAKTIEKTREDYLKKADPVAYFVNEMVEEEPDGIIPINDVYEKFIDFCRENKLVPCSDRAFGKKFRLAVKFPFSIVRKEIDGRTKRCYAGIKIRGEEVKFDDTSTLNQFEQVENTPFE